MVALLVDIGQFIIRLHEWLVAPVCEVEGHIKKVDDLFVSFHCDFKAIGFEHLADFLLGIYIYLCDFAKRCPLSFRLNMDITRVQASVAAKKKNKKKGSLSSC